MLVAIKTRRVSKIAVSNRKGERVFLEIPTRQWVIIESVTDVSKIINYENIINDDGEVYKSQWRTTPPFGTGTLKYIKRSGDTFLSALDATFSEIKADSEDAAREALSVGNTQFDPIIQEQKDDVLDSTFNRIVENAEKQIAATKYDYTENIIDEDAYAANVSNIAFNLKVDISNAVDQYVLDVYNVNITELTLQARLRDVSGRANYEGGLDQVNQGFGRG